MHNTVSRAGFFRAPGLLSGPAAYRRWGLCLVLALFAVGAIVGPLHVHAADNATTNATAKAWSVSATGAVAWLKTPEGKLFYSKGVNVVTGWFESEKSKQGKAFYWKDYYPGHEDWRKATEERLRQWGFNTRGGWSESEGPWTLPMAVETELGRLTQLHWFDAFAPGEEDRTEQKARELLAPFKGDARILGYFTDNEVGWWNTPLFRWYLAKGFENHVKQQLHALLFKAYDGDWSRLTRDFSPVSGCANWEDLKAAGVELKLRPGGKGIRVVNKFTALCARRYYELVHDALRKVDPQALILGDRFPLYYNQDAVLAMADFVDVISTNYNVDAPDGWVAPYYFEGLSRLSGNKPVLVSEYFFSAKENRSGNRNNGHLMTVDTQEERARGAARAALNYARFPNVVGAHWFQLYDEPTGGRHDGEDYNMGLLDIADRPYELLTSSLTLANTSLEAIHAQSAFVHAPERGKPMVIQRAAMPIDVGDASIKAWDKEKTRLLGFEAPAPYVPFGDVHLAWAPEGLSLLCLASDYLNTWTLDYTGEFPLSDAFQLHIRAASPTFKEGTRHYVISLKAIPSTRFPKEYEIKPEAFRYKSEQPAALVPVSDLVVKRILKPIPHIAFQAFIPAELLGKDELKAGDSLRLDIQIQAYFDALRMRWRAQPQEDDAGWGEAPVEAVLGP